MKNILPQWAPRVKKEKIRLLYELDARGIHDDELMDEVGWALLARCEAFLLACQARKGTLPCPHCGQRVTHDGNKATLMHCKACGWERTWGDYFKSIQHKQLSGAEPVLDLFADFIEKFSTAKTRQEKMFTIDRVLHGFHYWITQEKHQETRPTAINLMDGKLADVINFLDALSYGEGSTPGLQANYDEWFRRSQFARSWSLWDGKPWSAEDHCSGDLQ